MNRKTGTPNRFQFRIWDIEKKRWFNRSTHYANLFEPEPFGELILSLQTTKGFILMQSTGLVDKNGKEIFEGDILKHDLWGNSVIVWESGMFRGDGEPFRNEHDVVLADHQLKRSKIIGNIHENSNLIHP